MPPKRKDFLKPKGKAKPKAVEPQTENDFLEAADEEEAGAGKWKAGDPAKATRFYNRAIDLYNAGLARYPNSFDLAYNKANLEYKLIEDDRIVSILGNKINLLEETLQSHRAALALSPDNADVLFNTGQVMTALAEAILEDGSHEASKVPARSLLEAASDIFTKCLNAQVQEYEQIQNEITQANAAQKNQELSATPPPPVRRESSASSASSSTPGEWATVVEPLTPETILETCTAQLGALTTLLGLYDPSDLLSQEARAQTGLETANIRIPTLINLIPNSPFARAEEEPAPGPTLSISSSSKTEEPESLPKDDALLAAANFKANISELQYRSKQSSAAQYASQIEQIFAPLLKNPNEDSNTEATGIGLVNVLSSQADALIDLASAIADMVPVEDIEVQWAALSQAQSILNQLTSGKITTIALSSSRLADVFIARGDTDLFRFRIASLETAKASWVQSKDVLIANAGVLYRGARTHATKAGTTDVQKTADAKAIVAEILKEANGGNVVQKDHWKGRAGDVVRVLEQLVEEGVVTKENAEGVVRFTE